MLIVLLHDSLRAAEDLAWVDNLSHGPLEGTVAPGDHPIEFEMLGMPYQGWLPWLVEGVQVLRNNRSGEPFELDGRSVLLRPAQFQPGRPCILKGGAGPRSGRLTAELEDTYDPADAELVPAYLETCGELRKEPRPLLTKVGPFFAHVSNDPECDEALLAWYVQHELRVYSTWTANAGQFGSHPRITLDQVWTVGSHQVLTSLEAVALITALDPAGTFGLHPSAGGLPIDAADDSTHHLFDEVVSGSGRSVTETGIRA